MTSDAFFGIRLLLQFLCLTLPVLENAGQICSAILNTVFSAYAEFKLVLAIQEDFVFLKGLQNLLFIHLIMLFDYCAFYCMVMTICIAKPAIFLLHFYFLRHRYIMWSGLRKLLKVVEAIILHILKSDESLISLVRILIFATAF